MFKVPFQLTLHLIFMCQIIFIKLKYTMYTESNCQKLYDLSFVLTCLGSGSTTGSGGSGSPCGSIRWRRSERGRLGNTSFGFFSLKCVQGYSGQLFYSFTQALNKPTGTTEGQLAFQNCTWFTGIWHEPGAIPNAPGPIFKIQFNVTRT